MFGKTYKDTQWERDDSPYDLSVRPQKRKTKRRSKKEVLDSLEEHADGYIPDETDWLDRGE